MNMSKLRKVLLSLLLIFPLLAGATDKLDINTADSAMLAQALQGVGEKRAELIVAWRAEHGPFKSIDDLIKVKGIGQKIVDENREILTVGKISSK
jgi:competence protein ComEA